MVPELRGRRRNAFGTANVTAVTAGTPRVHVHLQMQLLMRLHMNRAMIRVS
ncbi:hypothetical protein M2271_004325 [Streptomyces sp. LBL]|nr:hypothetical protein [Streptomyces sp. LBL]